MDLQQVDPVRAQAAQARLEIRTDAPGTEIHARAGLSREGPALREDEDIATASFESAGDDLLGAAPTVEGRGVDPVDAQVERMSNRANRRRIVLRSPPDGPVTARADRRGPDSDRGQLQIGGAELPSLHTEEATRLVQGREVRVQDVLSPEEGDDGSDREERTERDAHLA